MVAYKPIAKARRNFLSPNGGQSLILTLEHIPG
jgi:hypothetical protein